MFTFTILTWCSSAMRSSTGETAWHGPHHSAQKSTITFPSDFRTSLSKVSVVALVANWILSQRSYAGVNAGPGTFVPGSYDRNMFAPLPDKPDHPGLELEVLELW